jgi:tetratricopeptide (TPR) repeat protein
MARKLTSRQLLVSMLALWRDLSHKEIGAAAGIPGKQVSLHLRRGELSDKDFEKLLGALSCPPAAVPIVTACLEALEGVEREVVLTAEERAEIEGAALGAARRCREGLTEAAVRSRAVPAEGYPQAHEIVPARQRAGELLVRLKDLPEGERLALVRWADEYQGWALCERVCEASVREASRNVERAAAWATLAQEIACRVRGPAQWRQRVEGYAAAHAANVLRVSGELPAAETLFEQARCSWQEGSDPAGVLDPGRLPDLEASLRRSQRRLDEALALLDEAVAMGRHPERALIKKSLTLELLGEYERAIETLLRAAPLVERQADRQLENVVYCNLAANYCHVGRFAEASDLASTVRGMAVEMGDELGVLRLTWIQGRIAAGQGRLGEARILLAQARREFAARSMDYDAALALLEEAALLLDAGGAAEVKVLARELAGVFESKGVHREALAALRLFQEAAEREEATAELARRVLGHLFRARYDQGLRFEGS